MKEKKGQESLEETVRQGEQGVVAWAKEEMTHSPANTIKPHLNPVSASNLWSRLSNYVK